MRITGEEPFLLMIFAEHEPGIGISNIVLILCLVCWLLYTRVYQYLCVLLCLCARVCLFLCASVYLTRILQGRIPWDRGVLRVRTPNFINSTEQLFKPPLPEVL